MPDEQCRLYAKIYQAAYDSAPEGQEDWFATAAVRQFMFLRYLSPQLSQGQRPVNAAPGVADWTKRTLSAPEYRSYSYAVKRMIKAANGTEDRELKASNADPKGLQNAKAHVAAKARKWGAATNEFVRQVVEKGKDLNEVEADKEDDGKIIEEEPQSPETDINQMIIQNNLNQKNLV